MLERTVRLAIVVAAFMSLSLHAQPPRHVGPGTSSGSRVVSPAVVATWISEQDPSGGGELTLLVLWRGTPGWFMGGRSSGGSTWGGESPSGQSGRAGGPIVHQIVFGGLTLNLRFDPQSRTANVQDEDVSLQDANVILVDRVDSAAERKVVGTRWIDPQVSGQPVRVEPLLRRSPEVVAFLRCDAVLTDPMMHKTVQMICAELLR